MSDTDIIDARGLSCPQPALMASDAIKKSGSGRIEVLVDTGTARENVTRLARKAGWAVEAKDAAAGGCILVLTK